MKKPPPEILISCYDNCNSKERIYNTILAYCYTETDGGPDLAPGLLFAGPCLKETVCPSPLSVSETGDRGVVYEKLSL